MEEKKHCALCKKEIQGFWVSGAIANKESIMCSECAVQILMQQNWNLQDENKALKDRWQKLKSFIKDKNIMWTYLDLLDKMQELEKEESQC